MRQRPARTNSDSNSLTPMSPFIAIAIALLSLPAAQCQLTSQLTTAESAGLAPLALNAEQLQSNAVQFEPQAAFHFLTCIALPTATTGVFTVTYYDGLGGDISATVPVGGCARVGGMTLGFVYGIKFLKDGTQIVSTGSSGHAVPSSAPAFPDTYLVILSKDSAGVYTIGSPVNPTNTRTIATNYWRLFMVNYAMGVPSAAFEQKITPTSPFTTVTFGIQANAGKVMDHNYLNSIAGIKTRFVINGTQTVLASHDGVPTDPSPGTVNIFALVGDASSYEAQWLTMSPAGHGSMPLPLLLFAILLVVAAFEF